MARYTPNWMQNGVYPAQLDRLLLTDAMGTQNSCLLSGTGAFLVSQHAAGASMVLDIAPGRGMVQGNYVTNQGNYEIFSDAIDNVTIGTAPGAGQSRIDLVIAQVRDTFVDGGGFNDFIFTTVPGTAAATGSQVAPALPSDAMQLAQVLVGPNVTSIVTANITDSRPFVRGQTVYTTVPALAANGTYTITHNLNSTAVYVQLWDTVTGQLVMTQINLLNPNAIMITVAQATPNPLTAIITAATLSPAPVLGSDLAPKAYVDARTPNLPNPVTTGTTVQSFTDALGDVWVAKNGFRSGAWLRARDVVTARIYPSANQASTAQGNTTITLNTANYDPLGLMSGTNIVVPLTGIYSVQVAIGFASAPAAVGQLQATLLINAAISYYGNVSYFGASQQTWPASSYNDTLSLAAGTSVGISVFSGTTAGTVAGGANGSRTYLAVQYLGTG